MSDDVQLIKRSIHSLRILRVELDVYAGENINTVRDRAIGAAVMFQCEVRFTFNGSVHHVTYGDVVAQVQVGQPVGDAKT